MNLDEIPEKKKAGLKILLIIVVFYVVIFSSLWILTKAGGI